VPRVGSTLRLSLRRHGERGDQVALVVMGATQWPDAQAWAAEVVPAWRPSAPSGGAGGREAVALVGDPGSDVLAFAQVNLDVATALRAQVHEAIGQFSSDGCRCLLRSGT
jgi:hypothetical protein